MANTILPSKSRRDLAPRREVENPIDLFQNEMNRLFDSFFTDPFGTRHVLEPWGTNEFTPRVDVVESDTDIKVTAELPGMDVKDIQISLENDSLVLSGEKKSEHEEKGKGTYRFERSFGSFQRVIPLDSEVEESKVEAQFKNGVLSVTLPKTPAAMKAAKKIEIKSS